MSGLVLALNAGSSNLKCALFDGGPAPLTALARTRIDGDGHAAVATAIDWAEAACGGRPLAAAGHRVVHGGSAFHAPTRLDAAVVEALERLTPLAPLHQPQALDAIRALSALRPGLLQVACFDTAFHWGQPPVAQRLGLTRALHDKGVRRYGFHGLSYDYVSGRLAVLDPALAARRVVAAHLGSGASLCAMAGGLSQDTTMGFSPLDGLLMATRCGTLDPGVVLYLQQHEGLSAGEVEDLLYHRAGLLGVSGLTGDMRALLASADPAAAEAVDLYVYRAAKEIAALAGAMGGLDGIVFTAGVGENSAEIRGRVAARLQWLGLELDPETNAAGGEGRISADGGLLAAWVIPTDEEGVIARQTLGVLAAV